MMNSQQSLTMDLCDPRGPFADSHRVPRGGTCAAARNLPASRLGPLSRPGRQRRSRCAVAGIPVGGTSAFGVAIPRSWKLRTAMFTRQCIPRAVAAVAAMLKDQVRRRVAVLQDRVAPLEVFIAEIGRFRCSTGRSATSHRRVAALRLSTEQSRSSSDRPRPSVTLVLYS